jgi:hypothetical protein
MSLKIFFPPILDDKQPSHDSPGYPGPFPAQETRPQLTRQAANQSLLTSTGLLIQCLLLDRVLGQTTSENEDKLIIHIS